MPAAFTHKLSVQVLDFEDIGLLIQLARLICDFCSSDQRFACGFLQIPPRDGHPCRPANDSPCRVRRRLSLPSKSALPGAPTKHPQARKSLRVFECAVSPVVQPSVAYQEDIPRPAPNVRVPCIIHLRPIAKLIAVLVSTLGQFVIERDRINAQFRQRV